MQLAKDATEKENKFMDYLDEVEGGDYGRLLFQGDPIKFQVNFEEWELEQEEEEGV